MQHNPAPVAPTTLGGEPYFTRRQIDENNERAMADIEWRMQSEDNYRAPRDQRTRAQVRADVKANRAHWNITLDDGHTIRIDARYHSTINVTDHVFTVIPPGGTVADGYRTLPGATRWSNATPMDGRPQGGPGRHLDQCPTVDWVLSQHGIGTIAARAA